VLETSRRQLEGARRKHERRPMSSLLVADRLAEIEPNDIAQILDHGSNGSLD
jgi:hypothetical protein